MHWALGFFLTWFSGEVKNELSKEEKGISSFKKKGVAEASSRRSKDERTTLSFWCWGGMSFSQVVVKKLQ